MPKSNLIFIITLFLLLVTACQGQEPSKITDQEKPTAAPAAATEPASNQSKPAISSTEAGDTVGANSAESTPIITAEATSITGLIAFSRQPDPNDQKNLDIFIMDTEGKNLRNLTNDPAGDGGADWSPDGTKIAWTANRDGNAEIYVMNADGSHVRRLTNEKESDLLPDWSPDGQTIAFASKRDGNWEIYLMNADGSNQRNLTNNPADDRFPDWSPDGKHLIFASDRGGNRDIYRMDVAGSNVSQLTDNPAEDDSPKWSPDGTQIVFVSARDGNLEIYLMNADGSNQHRLTNDLPEDDDPTWSPDGQSILWNSRRSGDEELYVMNVDSANFRRLTHNPGVDGHATVQPNSANLIAFGGEPVETQTPYLDLSPFVLSIELIEDSTVHVDDQEYQGDDINIILDPKRVRLPEGEQTDEDNFIIAQPQDTPIFSVLRTSPYDKNPTLHIGTKAELPPGAVLNIMPGEITLVDTGGSPAFFLNIPDQSLAAADSAASDSLAETAEPPTDPSAPVDLAPFVTDVSIDLEGWDNAGFEAYLELIFDNTKVKGINENLDSATTRDARHFSIIKPVSVPIGKVESELFEVAKLFTLKVWLKKDVLDPVVLYIAKGELEITWPNGQVSTGPFAVQVVNPTSAPEVMAITDSEVLASIENKATASAVPGEPLFPVLVNDKWGFINKAGQMVIEPQFADVHAFSFPTFTEGLEPVKIGDKNTGKWGYIDSTGQIVIEPQFDSANQFHDGLANFSIDQKIGYLDPTGQIIIEPQPFQNAFPFSEGKANFNLNGQWGFFDTSGQMVIQPQFDEAWAFSEGLAAVKVGGRWGYIDKTGQFAIQPQFDTFQNFSDGLAAVQSGGRVQYINSSGQVVLEPQLSNAKFSSFSEGLAPVKVGEKYGFMDKTGQMVIEPQFDIAYSFSEGLVGVQLHSQELYGYINPAGQVVIQLPIEFPSDPQQKELIQGRIILGNFFEGVAMLKINGQYGYVDKNGNYIWNPQTNSPGTSKAAGSAGDTLAAPSPTPAEAPPIDTPPPLPQPAQGPQLGVQEYLLTALTTALQMAKAVDQVKQLLQNPPADRSAWAEAISAQAQVVQNSYDFLLKLNPPADLQDEHAALLVGGEACVQATSLITDGVKNLNQDALNSAGPLMTTCGQKLVEATKLVQDYLTK